MKRIILFGIMLMSSLTFGQKRVAKIFEYKAINGINYRIGDTITLNKGASCYDGRFINVIRKHKNVPRYYLYSSFVITEIKQYILEFGTVYEFKGKIGNTKPNSYTMLIDCAIESDEIKTIK